MTWRIRDGAWRELAACNTADPEKFFPEGRPSNESRRPCRECPVRQECLEFALASPWEPSGIWGGMTAGELQPEWRRRHDGTTRQSEVHALLGIA